MGLLYLFPTQADEKDYVLIESYQPQKIRIKSYGLPWVFWLYAAACLVALSILSFSIIPSLSKLSSMGNWMDTILVFAIVATLVFTALGIFAFLYWQIHLVLTPEKIFVEYRPFGLKLWSKNIDRNDQLKIEVVHFLDSPNIARSLGDVRFNQFQNKGHFELLAYNQNRKVLLDRSSRRQDLEDLKKIIISF